MHIFIDTSIIYTDPFWKRNFAIPILRAAKSGRITLVFSDIVIKELRQGLIDQIGEQLQKINDAELELSKLLINSNYSTALKYDEYLIEFDNYYNDVFKYTNIIQIETDVSTLWQALDKAIKHLKPFGKNKSEFKDALIWLNYVRFCEINGITEAAFLTNNTSDFANAKGKILHQDLKKDFQYMKLYKTIEDLFQDYSHVFELPDKAFIQWLDQNKLSEEAILSLLFDSDNGEVSNIVYAFASHLDPQNLSKLVAFLPPYEPIITFDSLSWDKCFDIKTDIITDFAIISGVISIHLDMTVNSKKPLDRITDMPTFYTGRNFLLNFNFKYDKSKTVKNLELSNTRLQSM
jgi:tetratricopeptide (TPR) repeat protein